jgi:hypothetical protein
VDGSCWSGGCGQGAEALPAGDEGVGPWPVGADREGPLAGEAGEAGWQVPDPVAEGVRVGVPELFVVAVAEEAGPGGDVRGEDVGDDRVMVARVLVRSALVSGLGGRQQLRLRGAALR